FPRHRRLGLVTICWASRRSSAPRHAATKGPEQLGGGVLAPGATVLGEHRLAQRLAELQLRAHAEQGAVDDVARGIAVELPVLAGVPGVETGPAQPFSQVTRQDGVAAP